MSSEPENKKLSPVVRHLLIALVESMVFDGVREIWISEIDGKFYSLQHHEKEELQKLAGIS